MRPLVEQGDLVLSLACSNCGTRLAVIIDELEAIAESQPLTTQEIELKNQSNASLAKLLREEEIKWYQRSKAKFILQGDSNTRYFHNVANGRHRKKLIYSLHQEDGLVEGQQELKRYITRYYKGLFGGAAGGQPFS